MTDILTRLCLICAAVLFAAWLALRYRGRIARATDALAKVSRARLAAFLFFVAVATVCAQKPGGGSSPSSQGGDLPRSDGGEAAEVTNLCFTGISVSSNEAVLSLAWPADFLADGSCLDFFAKVGSLTNGWEWIGCQSVSGGDTNLDVAVELAGLPGAAGAAPSAAFFSVSDRAASAATMRDWDGDGIPDVYELHNGTNPYVPDAALAPRLDVGAGGDYADLASALAASTNYSIVSLPAGEIHLPDRIVMPGHPVLLTGPDGGYAVLRSAAGIAAVVLDGGQTEETLFRNLILVLEHAGGFQAGFWIGGNLPWSGIGASPTFENVRVRAVRPGTLYYGWHYYRDDGGISSLTNCVMNAAGTDVACGVYSNGGPCVETLGCAFLNFPTNDGSYATYFHGVTNTVAWSDPAEHGLSWAGYPLDGEYSETADSDGDGISDFDEIFTYDTDPWLADSDGDGVHDGDEVDDGTDPRVFGSFLRHVTVVATADDSLSDVTNYVAWGVAEHGWEANDVAAFAASPGTNEFTVATSNATVYAKAYRDMNRNGGYDEGADILLVKAIPEVPEPTIRFAFGDVDGDGVSDVQELAEGTDPCDAGNFRLLLTLVFENSDASAAATNHCEWGPEAAWAGDGAVVFAQTASVDVDTVVTNGVAYAKCLRDFNGDGVYVEGDDVLYVRTLAKADNGKTVVVAVGDRDHDGIPDGEELAEGTDPRDPRSYCFNLAFVENGVVHTTNDLSVVVKLGDMVIYGPTAATNRTFEADVGHVVVTNGGVVSAYFWDDANTNGVHDAEEPCVTQRLLPNGHESVITNTFQTFAFDRDRDGMFDWWEELHPDAGLSTTNSADAWLDFDGDGLINLHEYWADCDPLVYDGTNTAIYAAVHSVDDELTTTNSEGRLEYYAAIGTSTVVFNTNCWARNIDISCMSAAPSQRPATLITRKHFICAEHFHLNAGGVYSFVDRDGNVYKATVSRLCRIGDTDMMVGEFYQPLPESIVPAKILPADYGRYLGMGRKIPALHSDSEKKTAVADIYTIDGSYIYARVPDSEMRRAYYEHVVGGDSGHPRFLVFGDEVVLLDCVHRGPDSPGEGPSITYYREAIQQAIESFGDTNTWTMIEFDFSSYDKLPNN